MKIKINEINRRLAEIDFGEIGITLTYEQLDELGEVLFKYLLKDNDPPEYLAKMFEKYEQKIWDLKGDAIDLVNEIETLRAKEDRAFARGWGMTDERYDDF